MVNLAWARSTYFNGVVDQMGHGDEANRGLCFDVRTQDGGAVVDGRCGSAAAPAASRQFQVTFFNPLLLTVYRPDDLVRDTWTLRATVNDDAPLRTATREAQRTLGITGLAAIALTSALILAARAARTETQVATMRSDFAAAVTHELKTPIATIQLISERLASPRNTSIRRSREYANLSLQQARRLRRLIDNLLAYNRLTNVTDAYAFEPTEIATLVDECVKEFAFQLADGAFEVVRDVPADLPVVMTDPTAARLMLSNVIDNAIRYSGTSRFLHISARASDGFVTVSVTDHGIGISEKDLAMVTRRFYRGPHAESGGSGLGLFIAQQLACGHNGTLNIRSELGRWTTVDMTLPVGGDLP
jgi:signal transduction histidine kinase